MFTSICMYFGLLIVGAFLSYKGYIPKQINGKLPKIQTFFIFVLIFVMGLRLGMNEEVINSLTTIGLKAVIFTLFNIAGSILAVYLLNKKFGIITIDRKPKGECEND